mgnify:CR=1 FL=1
MDEKPLLIEKRNSQIYLRPRFSMDLNVNQQNLLKHFSTVFNNDETKFRGNIVDGHIFISVPQNKEHFWSPQLHLELIKKTKDTTELKGLFGPKPQVWTLFMFVHFVIGITFLGFCVLLYTKLSLNETYVFPLVMMIILPLLWGLLYFLGQLGKDTGKLQMKDLHDFMIENI